MPVGELVEREAVARTGLGSGLPAAPRSPFPSGPLARDRFPIAPGTLDALAGQRPVESLAAEEYGDVDPGPGEVRSIGLASDPRPGAPPGPPTEASNATALFPPPSRQAPDGSVTGKRSVTEEHDPEGAPTALFPAGPRRARRSPGQPPPGAADSDEPGSAGPGREPGSVKVAPEDADDDPAEPGESTPGQPTRRAGRRAKAGRHLRPGTEGGSRPPSPPPGKKRPKTGRRRRPTFWREFPMLVLVALLLTFLIQTFLARVYEIPSGSMEQTLHGCTGCQNDRVLVDKLSYRFGNPSPGDVIVFKGPPSWEDQELAVPSSNPLIRGLQSVGSLFGLTPPDEEDLIKRVIAVGGQTVACCDAQNRVTVDGKPLTEPYIYYLPEAGPPVQTEFGPVKVPEGDLWVMGDSRNNSADSRVPGHGPIPVSNVIGKARFVVLPFSRIKAIDDTNPQRVALSAPAIGPPPTTSWAMGIAGVVPLSAGRWWWRRRRRRARGGSDPGRSDTV